MNLADSAPMKRSRKVLRPAPKRDATPSGCGISHSRLWRYDARIEARQLFSSMLTLAALNAELDVQTPCASMWLPTVIAPTVEVAPRRE